MVKFKLRNFFRRSFPVITAMLLIVLCAAPASAATTGAWGVPFSFESIGLSGNVNTNIIGYAPFPLSLSGPSSTRIGGIDITSTYSDNSDGMVNIDYSLSSSTYRMRLFVNDVVLSSSSFLSGDKYLVFRFYDGASSVSASATISYTLGYVYEGNNYLLRGSMGQINVSNVNTVDISQLIADDVVSKGYSSADLGDYVLLSNLDITFDGSSPFTKFNIRQPLQSNGPTLSNWFDSQELRTNSVVVDPSNPAGVNFVDWLTVAIGGFLDFELWPGMSLNELLWVCLVIGILFTFFKMIV